MWCDSIPRTASWKPQETASSGTVKGVEVRVRPAWTSSIARSTKYSAAAAA